MPNFDHSLLLSNKSENALVRIAQRTGYCLAKDTISESDRRAAEQIARILAREAVERVRCELSKAIRHSKYLPRDLAMMLAHDVDSVSCPFLEVTEVFSDSDWKSLVLTIGRSTMVAVARRISINESLALSLAEMGDIPVVETLLENPVTPMDGSVGHVILDRFSSNSRILEKLGQRDDLIADAVVRMTKIITAAAREKIATKYNARDFTHPVIAEAETASILEAVENVSVKNLIPVAVNLQCEGSLKPLLVLSALKKRKLGFLVAALSVMTGHDVGYVARVLEGGALDQLILLLKKAHIPGELHTGFWNEVGAVLENGNFHASIS